LRVFISSHLVQLHIFKGITDFKIKLFISKPHVLSGNKPGQEDIDSFSDSERHGNNPIGSRLSVKAADEIRKIIENGKVVLHNDDVIIVGLKSSDQLRAFDSLLDIQIGRRLIEDVDFDFLDHHDQHSESLQLSTGKLINVSAIKLLKLQLNSQFVTESKIVFLLDILTNIALCCFGDAIHILGLDGRLEGKLKHLG
jgi:hypothetical protein